MATDSATELDDRSGKAVGYHALLDIHGAARLDDLAYIEAALRAAADAAGASIIASHFHHFGEGQGVTGVLLLAESHLSIHTWPERDYAAFDIFMCGSATINPAISAIRQRFPGRKYDLQTVRRGSA